MSFKHLSNFLPLLPLLLVLILAGCENKNNDEVSLWGYNFSKTDDTNGVLMLEHEKEHERITVTKATGLKATAAKSYIQDKIMVFRSLFEKQRIGYRGQHTEYVECPEQFKPVYHQKKMQGGTLQYLRSFANDRFITGVCSQDDIRYSAITAYLYCSDSRSMYEIDYFFPVDREQYASDFISRLRCE